jgi:indole-3-glycerol phosphate synthase
MDSPLPDALARIVGRTLEALPARKAERPLAALKEAIEEQGDQPRGFSRRLAAAAGTGFGLIAEIKRRSPSGGAIRPDLDVAEVARAYAGAGACCLSVLTEEAEFGGSLADLRAARDATDLPVLRKDFILDPWQVYESRAAGADCILLIMACLTDTQAVELEQLADALDMDVLAEVHDAGELQRALGLQTPLIGINNRNLRTLTTDLATTEQLAPAVPLDRVPVAESGIRAHADLLRLANAGARCFLVGEHLLRQPDPAAATRALLGSERACP